MPQITFELTDTLLPIELVEWFHGLGKTARERLRFATAAVREYAVKAAAATAQADELAAEILAIETRAAAYDKTSKYSLSDRERAAEIRAEAEVIRDRERAVRADVENAERKRLNSATQAEWLHPLIRLADHGLLLDPDTAPPPFNARAALGLTDIERLARLHGLIVPMPTADATHPELEAAV